MFERFPRLKFVITESGLAGFKPMLKQLDGIISSVRKGAIGELKYAEGTALPKSASEYFAQNVLGRARASPSPPTSPPASCCSRTG